MLHFRFESRYNLVEHEILVCSASVYGSDSVIVSSVVFA
jgi:hypothetical protein